MNHRQIEHVKNTSHPIRKYIEPCSQTAADVKTMHKDRSCEVNQNLRQPNKSPLSVLY